MSLFQLLPVFGFGLGAVIGARCGGEWGIAAGVLGAILGGVLGFGAGHVPLIFALRFLQRSYRQKSVEELRALLRDSTYPTPNTILLELDARGEDLEREFPVILDMLVDSSRDRRLRGWHALASISDRTARMTDYHVDDPPEVCREKVERLRRIGKSAASGASSDASPDAV